MPKTNTELVRDMLLRQYNDRDISAVDDYIAENHIDHNPMPGQASGRAGVRALIQGALDTGDISCEIHDSIGEGDLVATRYTITTHHLGEFAGIPAAGKTSVIHIIEMDRIANGQIVESWGESNVNDAIRALTASSDD